MSTPIRRTPRHAGTVVAARALTPRTRRITITAPTLPPPRPAQDVELVLDDGGRRCKRRYTVAGYRDGTFHVDAVLHGEGPGARWAASARPGDAVDLCGPRGRIELADADWHLFVGDEASLPAIIELAAALAAPGRASGLAGAAGAIPAFSGGADPAFSGGADPARGGPKVMAIIEVATATDELPVPAQVSWLHRGDRPAGAPDLLQAALARFRAPSGAGYGYALGESRTVAALRPRLAELGLAGERLYLKGYWNAWDPRRRAAPPSG
ncbi:MAG: siderophore-interacting protein [Actinomycetia bacterium]|nr:siderophore-interacting protein [Actinomycetes bacterium]